MTIFLYEAIQEVLERNKNIPMTVEDVASEINKRNLYRKRDGSQVNSWGVGMRALGDVFKSKTPIFDVLIRLR
jgi:hypothetical protein